MKKILLAFLLLTTVDLFAQNPKGEFEGVITYQTTIVLKDKKLDIDELYKVFGKERQYFFKNGKFKWVPRNVKLEYEVFNPAVSKSFLVDKYGSNDTLFYKDMSKIPDTVTSVKKNKQTIILGIPCHSMTFAVTDADNLKATLLRTICYPIDSLTYAAAYYNNFKAMGQSFISGLTKSIPLKMIMDSEEQPFSVVYEAIDINWKPLSDNEFELDKKLPVKR
jgi:hypothetical protein